MEFAKEFASFLYEKKIIRFGDFTLASGKQYKKLKINSFCSFCKSQKLQDGSR